MSDISGRGVGMDAVRNYVHEQGGEILIRLTRDLGGGFFEFKFELILPEHLFSSYEATTQSRAS